MDRCFCRQEVRRRHSQRRLAEPLSTNEKKGAIHQTSYGMQVLGLHAPQARLSAFVLLLCLMFFSLGLHDESSPVSRHSSKYALFKVSPVGFHNTCSLTLWVLSLHLGFTSAGVAPFVTTFRKLLDETVKTFAVFPSCLQLLDCDDNCMLSDPLSTSALHYSRWQSGEICQVFSTGAFTLFCHVFMVSRKIYSPPLSLLCYCLAHAFVCSMFPVFSA